MAQSTVEERLAVIEEILGRVERSITERIGDMEASLNTQENKLNSHLVSSDTRSLLLNQVDNRLSLIERIINDPKDGLLVRQVMVDQFISNFNKVIWEIARPGLAMLGTTMLVGIGIFAILIYSLQYLFK